MKIKAIYLYSLAIIWAALLAIVLKYANLNTTGFGITLTFLTCIFIPGIFLWRISRISAENMATKLLYLIGFGFSYYFLFNLLGLIFSLSLNQVIFFNIFGIIILLILAIYRDRQAVWNFDFKSWFKGRSLADWLLDIIFIGSLLTVVLCLNAQINSFVGDTYFHLAILRKITTAVNLDPHNLWAVKSSSLNIIYSFPLWHIFVGQISKLLGINIFTAYSQVLLPLAILSLLVWWGFARVFFKNRYVAGIIYLIFLIYFWNFGYFSLFVPLRSPDSLNRLLIFPLLLALSASYLFVKSKNIWPNVILLSLLGIFMGLIHFTQLIEYFLILFVFFVLALIFYRNSEVLKKLGWLLLALGGTILFYLGIFQTKAIEQFLLGNFNNFTKDVFRNKTYKDTSIFNLYAVFSLPFLALFFKKNYRLILLAAIPLTLMMITWQIFQVRVIFLKYFGEIFVTRAITDIPGFIFFGFLILLFILGINYLFSRVRGLLLYISYFLSGIIVFVPLIFYKSTILNFIDLTFFGGKNFILYDNFILIFILAILAALTLWLVGYVKKADFSLDIIKDARCPVVLAVILCFVLSWAYFAGFNEKIIANQSPGFFKNSQTSYFGEIERMGGEKTADYFNNFTSKDVFAVSNTDFSQMILLYCKCFVAEYPYKTSFSYSAGLYNPSTTLEARQEILNSYSINYVIAISPQEEEIFKSNPEIFEVVFENRYTYLRTTKSKGASQKEGEFVVFKYLK